MSAAIHPDDDLSAYIDGELDGPAAEDIRAHLDGCARCRGELDRLEAARDALRLLAPVEPPAGLVERFWIRTRRFIRIMAAVAAGAGSAALVVLWVAGPERAVHPPVDEVGAQLPALPAGQALSGSHMPEGWNAPGQLDGLPLVSLREVGAMTGAVYASGSQSVMLLEEPGQLVTDDYPVTAATLDGKPGYEYMRNGTEEFTWQAGTMVMTLVGTPDELGPAGSALPAPPQSRSLIARTRSLCRELIEDLTGG